MPCGITRCYLPPGRGHRLMPLRPPGPPPTLWKSSQTLVLITAWRTLSGVRSAYERSYPTSGPVSTGVGDRLRAGVPSRYVTSQLGQLSPASLPGSLNRVPALAGGKGGNVSSAGWQVCDPIWHVSSRSGEPSIMYQSMRYF